MLAKVKQSHPQWLSPHCSYRQKRRIAVRGLFWICPWLLFAIPTMAFSWSATVDCDWQVPTLQCAVQPLAPIQIQRVELSIDSQANKLVADWQSFVDAGRENAILWLVDISDPARAATVKQQQQLLRAWLLRLMQGHYQLGLATFADNLRTLAPVNSEPAVLNQAINGLSAQGHSTALYQSLLNSLELLKWTKAERKSLWIFSDGLAEDTAYRHEDVVLAARKANVVIVALGYPERKSQQPQLQRLQRLAEETNGYFVAASEGRLPPDTLMNILTLVDGGGLLSLDLPELYGPHQVILTLWDSAGDAFVKTFTLEGPPSAPIEPARLVTKVVATPSVQSSPIGFTQPPVTMSSMGGYWFLAASVLGVMILFTGRLVRKKRVSAQPTRLARFENLHSGKELAVAIAFCRLGRAPDNDLCFNNDSVSAHHAELYRHRDGAFAITDLNSTNGVWVNDERVTIQDLRNGDIVELGEIRLRFWEVPQSG